MSENGDKSRKMPCEICNKSINHTKLKNHIDEVHHGLKKFKMHGTLKIEGREESTSTLSVCRPSY